ncbi:TonB-dependent receptor [Lentisalinibacter salinarum]|uniref:TonB-dependent receptor n=1 Tax=Lentisalinibacter salinarum TaxID=2992239 RepID=UPI00386338A3
MPIRYRYARRLGAVMAVALPVTGFGPVAVAQETEQGARAIEEVVVTARRREESLQDVPLSITAFSGDDLARIGALNITEVGQTTPNVTLEVSRGTNTTITAFIRGVGQQDPVPGFEAGVGIYIDDVYLNRPQAAVLDIYDVERIEVLRGPQGTLYGRNTIGGAIKYVTKRLSDEPEAKVKVAVGNYNQLDTVVTASTPVFDTLRIGGSVARLTHDGFGDNLNLPGTENYAKDLLAGRFSVEWLPSDTLFFRLTGDYLDDDSDPRQGHRLTVGNLSGAPILDDVYDTRAGLNNPTQEVQARGISLLAEWDISPAFTLKSITAYRDDETYTPIDFDSLPAADLDVPAVYENDQFSQELQVLYEGDRLSGVAGAYYLDANAFTAFDVILGTTGDLLGLPGLNAFTLGDVDTETWSLFADFTYQLTDVWAVSVGGRYTSDERSSRVLRQTLIGGTSSYFGGSAIPIATTSDFDGSEKFTEFTPRFSVSYAPSDTQNLYFTWSEGFKGGSFDPRGQTSSAPDLDGDGDIDEQDIFEFMLFQPETVSSYEVGVKSSWLDNTVNTNIAVFFADYQDVQIPGSVGIDSDNDGVVDTFIGITSNAADADIFGVEFEGAAQLSDAFRVNWMLGYIDAEFNEFIDALGNDVAEERVFQNTPEVTASATLIYERPTEVIGRDANFSVRNTLSYRDDTSQFEVPTPELDQDAYTLWDLSFVLEDPDGRWRLGLHGKNLTDKEYKVAGYYFPDLGLESSITAFYGDPRRVMGTFEYRF